VNQTVWLVETEPDHFQRIGGQLVIENGVLVFYGENGSVQTAYASGTWLTVSREEA
jgi:hypothetical protein